MKKFLVIVLGLFMFCQFPLLAKDHGNGKGKSDKAHQQKEKKDKDHGKLSQDDQGSQHHYKESSYKKNWRKDKISNAEKQIFIKNYLQLNKDSQYGYYRNLPPGLAKKLAKGKGLPPGWQKKIIVGEVMPDDIYYQTSYLPVYIVEYLPPQPAGTKLVVADGKVVRLIEATKTILDVFDIQLP